jgi:hypothetical protein
VTANGSCVIIRYDKVRHLDENASPSVLSKRLFPKTIKDLSHLALDFYLLLGPFLTP